MRALILRGLGLCGMIFVLWQALVMVGHIPPYILPTPLAVLTTWWDDAPLILSQASFTIFETFLGLILGVLLGCIVALSMSLIRPLGLWLLPLLIISQAIPTFAVAPLFVLWLGYGLSSKVATTLLMLFFPVTSAFYQGLTHTPSAWLDLGRSIGGTRWRHFWHIQIPAALPYFVSGLRIATAVAPIGAIVGEWVGASHGLGFLMLNANARMQIDLMFAALFTLVIFSLLLYFIVDRLLRRWIWWQ